MRFDWTLAVNAAASGRFEQSATGTFQLTVDPDHFSNAVTVDFSGSLGIADGKVFLPQDWKVFHTFTYSLW